MRYRMGLIAALLAGCGEGGDGSGNTLSGSIVKGPVAGATVCVYELAAAGKGNRLGCTTTGSDGSYDIDLDYAGPVVVEATGGTYTDEATGVAGTTLGAPLITVGAAGSGNDPVIATPLTTIAFNQAASGGGLTPTGFASRAQQVGAAFGLGSDVDIARTLPNVSPGSTNPYGDVLIGVSKMMRAGATLPAIASSASLDSLGTTFQACSTQAPALPVNTLSIDLQVDLRPEVPADGAPTVIDVFEPYGPWRATLPASGAVNQTSCLVTLNTEAQVSLSCAPTSGVAGVSLFAGGSAAQRTFEAQPLSYELPSLAGNKIVFSGGALRTNAGAPIYLNGGTGRVNLSNVATTASVTVSSGQIWLGGVLGDSCGLTSGALTGSMGSGAGAVISLGGSEISGGSLNLGSAGDVSLSGGSISLGGSAAYGGSLDAGDWVSLFGGSISLAGPALSGGAGSLSGGSISVAGQAGSAGSVTLGN